MIKQILELLALEKHYGQSEVIEIAKGKYKLVTTWQQGFEKIKRQWKIR
jgi:hypothetical protein